VPNIKCFDPDKTWKFFMQALQELETRFDAARLHVTGYSMGAWMQTARLGDGFRSIYHGLGHLFDLIDPTMVVQLPSGKHRKSY
jgi:hypothetical protein